MTQRPKTICILGSGGEGKTQLLNKLTNLYAGTINYYDGRNMKRLSIGGKVIDMFASNLMTIGGDIDMVLCMIDNTKNDRQIKLDQMVQFCKHKKNIVCANKIDLHSTHDLHCESSKVHYISAMTGEGIDDLIKDILASLDAV